MGRQSMRGGLGTRVTHLALVMALCAIALGCSEANFELAPASRLPKWFTPPPGMQRRDVTVTMDYYAPPSGGTATFKMFDQRGRLLEKQHGELMSSEPLTFTPHIYGQLPPYPSYEVITVNGIVDIVEHRAMEPVFYLTDDPEVWAKWGPKATDTARE